jgi:hypothetical protein
MAERRPDIEAGARVRARRLRFGGDGPRRAPGDARRNLPGEIEPAVTYRDVEVLWHSKADVETRIDPRLKARMEEEDA